MKDDRTPATRLQDSRVADTLNALDENKDVVLFAPTGAGKSRMFSLVAADRAEIGERTLVLTNRKKLVTQAKENMRTWGNPEIAMSIGMDGLIDLSGDVVYSTVQTAHQHRDRLGPIKNVILDEMHNAVDKNTDYEQTLAAIKRDNPNVLFIGASATPPEEYKGMDERFAKAEKVVITYDEAVAVRLIELPETFTPPMIYESHDNVASVVDRHRKPGGGYESGITGTIEKMRGEDWNDQLLNLYERHMKDDQTIAFFDTIEKAKAFHAGATERGIPAALIHSKQSTRKNDEILESFNESKFPLLVSVDMISEGVDTRATSILNDKIRTSKREFQQINGRASRSYGQVRQKRGKLYDTGASPYLHGDIGALATMSTMRAGMEGGRISDTDMLPDSGYAGFKPWVAIETPKGKREVFGTSIDDRMVYVTRVDDRYAAFITTDDKKGRRTELLAIDGERKGMPTADGLGRWLTAKLQSNGNEHMLSRMTRQRPGRDNELTERVNKDWSRNGSGTESSIETMIKFMPQVAAAQSVQRAVGA